MLSALIMYILYLITFYMSNEAGNNDLISTPSSRQRQVRVLKPLLLLEV
jgi:hypothetical protein